MKKSILLLCLVLCGISVFAQNGLEVKGYFGISGTLVGPNQDLIGSSSVSMADFREFGLLVSHGIGPKFRINTGVNYSYSTVEFSPAPCPNCFGNSLYVHNPDFEMLSIPVFAEYGLGKYFYAAAGTIIDFQLSEGNNFSDQSGFGYLAGLGARFGGPKLSFTVFPNYKRHSVIPFEQQENLKDVLQEFGVQFGIGYKF